MFKEQSVETRKKIRTPWDADDVGGCYCIFWRGFCCSDKNEAWLLANKMSQRLTLVRLERWPGTVSLGLPAFMDKDGTPEVHWNLECTETSKRHIINISLRRSLHSCGHRVDTGTCIKVLKVLKSQVRESNICIDDNDHALCRAIIIVREEKFRLTTIEK